MMDDEITSDEMLSEMLALRREMSELRCRIDELAAEVQALRAEVAAFSAVYGVPGFDDRSTLLN